MKDFIKAFFSFGLATSIEKLLGFIILPIYTRQFNQSEYGIIDMIGTILAVAVIFGLLQLETALQRYYFEYKGVKRKLLISSIYTLIGSFSFLIAILLFFLAPIISLKLFQTYEYANLIRIVAFQLPLSNISMLGLVLLRFEKENIKFLTVIVTKVIFALFFVYIFVIYLKLGLAGVFYAQVCALSLSTTIATYYVRHLLVFKASLNISRINLKYALPQFPARVGSMILAQASRFFMLGYLSLSAIGIYSVSVKLASSIQLVNSAFILAWAPFMFAQFKKPNHKIVFANVFPMIAGATFLCVCLIALFAQEMVQLLATEEFHESSKYVGGLSLFYALYVIKESIDIGPKIREKTKYLSFTFLLSVIVNLSSLFIFVQLFQIEGVVFSMIITNLFLVGMSWFISNRLYYIPYRIITFFILLLPAFFLAIYPMFVELQLSIRIIIAIFCVFFYSTLLLKYYKRFRILKG